MFFGGVYCVRANTQIYQNGRFRLLCCGKAVDPETSRVRLDQQGNRNHQRWSCSYVGRYLLKGSGLALLMTWSFCPFISSFIRSFVHAFMQRLWGVKLGAWNLSGYFFTSKLRPSKLRPSKLRPQASFYSLLWPRISLNCPGYPWTQADFNLVILLPQPSDYLGLQDCDTRPGFTFHFPDSVCLFPSYWDELAGLKYNWRRKCLFSRKQDAAVRCRKCKNQDAHATLALNNENLLSIE